jgi:predicted transcriptional regulator
VLECGPSYRVAMAEVNEENVNQSAPILDEEDEATLEAIDRGIRSADEGRVVPIDEVRQRMRRWITKSSSLKTLNHVELL